jgi:DNA-binding SARP family transcriptional activator
MKKEGGALAIHLLGPFRVSVLGKPVDESHWARPQGKVLLKLLALEPKHQLHRQQIMDAIWPDLDESAAAANLHKIIHMARRALEPKLKTGAESRFIHTRDQNVQLATPEACGSTSKNSKRYRFAPFVPVAFLNSKAP